MSQPPNDPNRAPGQSGFNFAPNSSFSNDAVETPGLFNGQNPYGDVAAQRRSAAKQHNQPTSQPSDNRPSETTNQGPKLKKQRRNPIALFVIPGLILAVAIGILWSASRPAPLPPEPTPSTYVPKTPTPSTGTPENHFSYAGNEGTFIIHESRWENLTLEVDVEVILDAGDLSFQFMAMDYKSSQITQPQTPSRPGDLDTNQLSAGESARGIVRFHTGNRADQNVAIFDRSNNRNLTMIKVPA